MTKNKKLLGSKIKFIRHTLGLTMEDFGKLFNPHASDSIVSRWERGISSPNNERLKVIADIGIYTMEQLLEMEEDEILDKIPLEEKKRLLKERNEFMDVAKQNRRAFLLEYFKEENLNTRFAEVTDGILFSALIFSKKYKPDDDNQEYLDGIYLSNLISGINHLKNFKQLNGKVDKKDVKDLYKFIDVLLED